MTLNHLAAFVHQEGGFFFPIQTSSKPSAAASTARQFRRLQGTFSIGMDNDSPLFLRLRHGPSRQVAGSVVPPCPDVVRHFRGRRSNKNGIMCNHDPKGINGLCQSVALV